MGRCKPPGSANSFLSYAPQPSGTKSCFSVHLIEWQCGRRLLLAFPCPPIPVFLPVKSHGQRSLAGYHPWGCRVGQDWATKHSTEPLPAPQQSLWGCWWWCIAVLGALIHIWGQEIADVCAIYSLLICQEIFSFQREKSISYSIYFIKSACA